MNIKTIQKLLIVSSLVVSFSASALTVPKPDSDIDKLSYSFYLFFDNGQLFADRDYEIKYDVMEEIFVPQTPDPSVAYKAEIINFKSEVSKTFTFDPRAGKTNFNTGKIMIRGPYTADAMRVQFYDNKGMQLLSIFINAASICNDDGSCNSAAGENEKSCPIDCKKSRPAPTTPAPSQTSGFLGDLDIMTIVTYAAGGVGVIVLGWFGRKWLNKKREGSFLPPPPPSVPPAPPAPPSPPIN